MKKLYRSTLVVLSMMFAVFTMPTMATPEATADAAVAQEMELDIFKLDVQEDIKVAPRDPHDRCKTHPESQPYCKKKVKKKGENVSIAKLKCKKAKTCDTEPSLLERLRQLLA